MEQNLFSKREEHNWLCVDDSVNTRFLYDEKEVKKAINKSQKNNRKWCDIIMKIIDSPDVDLTEQQEFDIKTALDGIMNQNKDEVFGL